MAAFLSVLVSDCCCCFVRGLVGEGGERVGGFYSSLNSTLIQPTVLWINVAYQWPRYIFFYNFTHSFSAKLLLFVCLISVLVEEGGSGGGDYFVCVVDKPIVSVSVTWVALIQCRNGCYFFVVFLFVVALIVFCTVGIGGRFGVGMREWSSCLTFTQCVHRTTHCMIAFVLSMIVKYIFCGTDRPWFAPS